MRRADPMRYRFLTPKFLASYEGSNTNWSIWIPRERWKIQIRERRNSIAADLSRQVQLHSWNDLSLHEDRYKT